tara:strand:+ start:3384 stop:5279 length:1896 start_codon:yes stop_codon:yes gene_type:complete
MNILEQEDLIKGLDDRRLQEEAKRPSGNVPQFLVVSEIQRRTDMRKKFQGSDQQQPQGTIADQITQAGIGSIQPPQMMQGQPMPMQAYGGGMTPFMRKYAGGGVVRMQRGGMTPQDQMLSLFSNLKGRGFSKEDVLSLVSSQSPRGGETSSILDIFDNIKSPLSQAFSEIYPNFSGTTDTRLNLSQNLGNEFSNAVIEDSNSASLNSATVGDPPADGYVEPVSINMPEVVSKEMSLSEMLGRREMPESNYINNLLNMNSPESRLVDAESAILSGYTPKAEAETSTERGLGGLLDRGEDSAKGLLRSVFAAGDKLPSGREVGDFLNSKNLPSSYDVGQFVGPQVSQINRVLNVPYDAAYNAIAPVTEGIQNIYRGMTGQDSVDKGFRYPSLSDKFSSAASAFAGDDPVEANINATPQTDPAVIKPKVDAEVSGDVVVKSAEETIKRARDKSSQSDIDANVNQNRITSGASGLGNLFGLEGDKKQAFSMALMALGAGIAKGDTAGGLKDAGLAMNAINEQSLDREDKRLDRIGEAEDRALRRLALEDSSAARKQRTQETASYRLQTLMASYLKDRGSVDTPEQKIEYENKLRKALSLPVLELNTGADVGLTGGNLSSSAGGNMSYSKETGLKK